MWVKIEFIKLNESTIVLPIEFKKRLQETIKLVFGGKTATVTSQYNAMLSHPSKSTFENPIIINFSYDLKNKLLIPETQIYQAKCREK